MEAASISVKVVTHLYQMSCDVLNIGGELVV
jgi:hypothetical protein